MKPSAIPGYVIRFLSLVFAAILLAACGGGSGDEDFAERTVATLVGPATVVEGEAVQFTVRLNRPALQTMTIFLSASGDAGSFTLPSQVTIPRGRSSASFTVVAEPGAINQEISIALESGRLVDVGTAPLLLRSISADEAGILPVVTLVGDGQQLPRGASTTFVVTLDGPSAGDVVINLLVVGNATGLTAPPTVTVTAGNLTAPVTINAAANAPLGERALQIPGGAGYVLGENTVAAFEVIDQALPLVSLVGPGAGDDQALFKPAEGVTPGSANTFALILSESRDVATEVHFALLGNAGSFEVIDPTDVNLTLTPLTDPLVIPADTLTLVFNVRARAAVASVGDTAVLRIVGGADYLPDPGTEDEPADRRNLRIANPADVDSLPLVQFLGPDDRTIAVAIGATASIALNVNPAPAAALDVNYVYSGPAPTPFTVDGADPSLGGPLAIPQNTFGANPPVERTAGGVGRLFLVGGSGYRILDPLDENANRSFLIIAEPLP